MLLLLPRQQGELQMSSAKRLIDQHEIGVQAGKTGPGRLVLLERDEIQRGEAGPLSQRAQR